MQKIPRLLDAADRRVLGALLEKEQTTPEVYPLTVNALVAACNQKTAREPVMELSEAEVQAALRRLFEDVLVWRAESARVTRWRQSVERRWALDGATKAIMTLLLLRGPQTIGELRNRSERLHAFASTEELEAALVRLAAPPEPLVAELPRGPGQKEARWMHLVGDEPIPAEPKALRWASPATSGPDPSLAERVAVLERRLDELERRIEGIPAPG
ncbi:MAG: YceH family protein [Acidobacteriota bacterium]